MEHGLGSIAIFIYSHLMGFTLCSIEKLNFENIIFQHHQSLNSHSASWCNNENQLLNFTILMLLGNYDRVTIYKTSKERQPHHLAIKYQLKF